VVVPLFPLLFVPPSLLPFWHRGYTISLPSFYTGEYCNGCAKLHCCVFGSVLLCVWLHVWLHVAFWVRVGCVLAACWLRVGCVLAACWLRVGCVLVACWLRVGCVLCCVLCCVPRIKIKIPPKNLAKNLHLKIQIYFASFLDNNKKYSCWYSSIW
jgi:hypothetical protein